MHAVRLHAFGPPENLRYEEVADPVPGPGQLRIAVAAAGVHLIDTTLRAGKYGDGPMPAPRLPTVPGREVAGVVDALGEGADPDWLGRRVVAHLGMVPGGYAELAVTDAARVHRLPDGLGFPEAVAMIGTGRTTVGLLRLAGLTADDTVLVLAAAGGIGTLLVQHTRRLGATVVGAAGGPAKTARVRSLGADLAVDYARESWTGDVRDFLSARGLGGVTVVLDAVGGALGHAATGLLSPGGRHLVYGWAAGGPVEFADGELAARGITSHVLVGPALLKLTGTPEGMRGLETEALAAAADGRLVPAVETFPLADAAAAHRALESRATMGKVVLLA
ncbi:zinc-binding dehydrogenase [Streptomyces sp. NPDC051976]|uniref:zinc-binding dehydrogenase n=1 Tax=Streptomyces sp. NPDC051976 TaxID=3154947 RepID=UPI0034202641